jgi:hypothetical protein
MMMFSLESSSLRRLQLFAIDRLVEEVVGAALQRVDLVVRAGERGQHEDGDRAAAGRSFDDGARFVAVHHRHHHVEDDDRRVVLRVELYGFAAVARDDDVVTPTPEVLLEQLQVLIVVVDSENQVPLACDGGSLGNGHMWVSTLGEANYSGYVT